MAEIDAFDLSLYEVNSRIRNAIANNDKVVVKNACHLSGLACGLTGGEVVIESDVCDYLGMLNSGAKIHVKGCAGNYVGDGSWSGEIIIDRDAGYGVGIYAYGGTIVVKGNVGDGLGKILKGATVLVNGNAGSSIGLYMVGGDIIIVGNAGELVGDWMIRGTIYIGGSYQSLGHNAKEAPLTEEDVKKLEKLFGKYGIDADAKSFKKIVPVFVRPFYGESKKENSNEK